MEKGSSDNGGHGLQRLEEVRLSKVHLKILGDNLEVQQAYEEDLELVCACQERACNLTVYDSKKTVS